MVMSMTGYGRGEYAAGGKKAVVEMKSVNHRFLEFSFRLPRGFTMMEEYLRPILKEKILRGRVEVYVNLEEEGEKKRKVELDKALAIEYANSLKELAERLDISYNIKLQDIAAMPEVLDLVEEETPLNEYLTVTTVALKEAAARLLEMRKKEGEHLAKDILNRTTAVSMLVKEIKERSPAVVAEYQEKLTQRLHELLDNQEVEEQRIAQEIVFFADRANITEETVRLESHLLSLEQEFKVSKGAIGRKLDFLIQEINRELNTIGSKGNDVVIAKKVVEAKSEVEKMREQVQNLE